MTRILVYPERLTDVGRRFISDGEHIAQIGQRLSGAVSRLDWESRARIGMEDDFAAARARAEGLGQQLIGHGQRLIKIAERFERADNEAAQDVAMIPWDRLLPVPSPSSHPWVLPRVYSELYDALSGFWLFGRTPLRTVAAGIGRLLNWTPIKGNVGRASRLVALLRIGVVDHRTRLYRNYLRPLEPSAFLLVGAALDYLSHSERGFRPAVVALGTQGVEYLLASLNPYVAAALIGNGLIQAGGAALIWWSQHLATSVAEVNQELAAELAASTERVVEGVAHIDLENVARDVVETAYDTVLAPTVEAVEDLWKQPSWENAIELTKSFAPLGLGAGVGIVGVATGGLGLAPAVAVATGIGGVGNVIVSPEVRHDFMAGVHDIAGSAGDILEGVGELATTLPEHAGLMIYASYQLVMQRITSPPSLYQQAVHPQGMAPGLESAGTLGGIFGFGDAPCNMLNAAHFTPCQVATTLP